MRPLRWLLANKWLILVLLSIAGLSTFVWQQPFGRDQGIFAYIGEGILDGHVPYRDAWDHKPPGIDFTYSLAFAVFGRQMISVHILETCSILATAYFLHRIGRNLRGQGTAVLAALVYGFGTVLLFEWWDRGQAEMFMSLPMTLSAYCLLRRVPSPWWSLFLAGLLAGIAMDFKPTAAPWFLVVFLVAMISARDRARLQKTRARWSFFLLPGITILGLVVSQVPMFSYFAVNGAVRDLYEAVVVFNTFHVQTGASLAPEDLALATLQFGERMSIVSPLAVLGGIIWLRGRDRRAGAVVLAWVGAAVLGIWMQGKFFSYHWSLVLPPLALLAAVGAVAAGSNLRHSFHIGAGAGTSPVVLTAIACLSGLAYLSVAVPAVGPKLQRDLAYLTGREQERDYLANFGHNIRGTDVYSFLAAQDTAAYLDAQTKEDDTILVWGFQALVNYLAHRRAPSRYVFDYPLTIEQPESELRQEARDTFLTDIREKRPIYIVTVTNDVNPLQAVDSQQLLNDFPEFKAVIDRDYRLEKDIADFHLYRRLPDK